MPYAHNGDVRLYYETRGRDSDPAVLLIEGLSVQLLGWRPELIDRFVARGLRPVLFDNRDVGLSSKLGGPDATGACYTLWDMARDVLAVADDLGLDTFHVAGQSLGGMIAQVLLAEAGDRVRSVTLFYTAPAFRAEYLRDPDQKQEGFEFYQDADSAVEGSVARERVSSSPGYPFDEDWARDLARRSYERCYEPAGNLRQMAAVESFHDGVLAQIQGCPVPATITHGSADAYFLPRAAIDLYQALPQAELHLFPGMGHELVEPLWDAYADSLARTVARGTAVADKR